LSNFWKRILLAAIFVPALIVLVMFMPWLNNLALSLMIFFFAFTGARELALMYQNRGVKTSPLLAGILGLLPSLYIYLDNLVTLPQWIGPIGLMALASLLLAREGLLKKGESVEEVLPRLSANLSFLIYPGFFMAFIQKLTLLPHPSESIILYLSLVFMNDSAAYFVGSSFGKNNKGIFTVSPNKSLAGLFGGLGGSILSAFVVRLVFPAAWDNSMATFILLAISISLLSVVGDLVESALKRSGGVKDSGKLLGGRGGVLDSLDSLMFAAPLFYFWLAFIG